MSNLDTILEHWREQAAAGDYNKERLKGSAFEALCKVFLTHDSVQRGLYEPPMTYAEWAQEMGLPIDDTGIDLVAKIRETQQWCAIQCKFYAKGKTLQKSDIDSFLADSSRKHFARRLIIDATGKDLSPKLENTLRDQEPEVVRIGLHELRKSSIQWDNYVQTHTIVTQSPKTPRPHQIDAIDKTVQGLRESGSRGMLIMACGTGKTYTSLRIAEDLIGLGGRVLYLVPSLALMSQTVREWANDTRLDFRFYAVCSDAQVGRRRKSDDDRIDMSALDLAFPATTNASILSRTAGRCSKRQLTVIFATYHSLPVVSKAQSMHGLPEFDLTICDEAHRTAGARLQSETDSPFVMIHDQAQVRTHRRLYMTATPKVYAESARNTARKVNAALCSMENKDIYGPVLYEIGFGEAVEQGLLTDYKVVILTVPEESVILAVGDTMEKYELTLSEAGKYIGCWRALSKIDVEEFGEDILSMRRAIAYCQSIKYSKQLAKRFHEVIQQYRDHQAQTTEAEELIEYGIDSRHVDGTFGALARTDALQWLDSVAPQDRVCHVLSNVRCLSEGVDVPALDAILFMQPRKSQIEVVQAVGRVMRRSESKSMGYVILPVVIPSGANATEELDNNRTFRVVWQVLNAIRSHDERFEAMLNLLEEGKSSKHLGIISLSDWQKRSEGSSGDGVVGPDPPTPSGEGGGQMAIEFGDLPAAIRAKIAEKCGTNKYWDEWAVDVAEIAQKHIVRIEGYVNRHKEAQDVFQEFLDEIQDDLNEGISKRDAIEMLAQHMVTRPVFEALHGDSDFVDQNPISKGMQLVLDVLKPANIEVEAESLDKFYASVARRAKAANTPRARQKVITELYDKFFRNAFPKTASRLGVVYSPIEIVDFILHSVDDVLRSEFGESLSSEGVQVLDPFTGTGTFITRMIQNGLIDREALPRKYRSEIHANEIMLLAYYIAAVNIEDAYHAMVGTDAYERFPGIILTDTFEMQDKKDEIAELMVDNSEQRKRQKASQIRVIVGNPPWSAGQKSQNDAAQNQSYPILSQRIEDSYAKYSDASSVRNLYDSYILALRWVSDRIGKSGVIGFVTNSSWLDSNAMDGMRRCLEEEFRSIYVLNLKGNLRTQGERLRTEGGNVFGVRTAASVLLLVKHPSQKSCHIRYYDIGDYLSANEKLQKLNELKSITGIIGQWIKIKPDVHHDWLNQRDAGFEKFMALGDKKNSLSEVIFKNYSLGVATGRDAWCYNFSEAALRLNIQSMIRFYESERQRLLEHDTQGRRLTAREVTNFVNNDKTKISWTRALKNDLANNKALSMDEGRVTMAQYRPFTKTHMYFSRRLNECVYQMPQIFPHEEAENKVICVTGRGETVNFSSLMLKYIPNLHTISSGQCFPRWLYAKPTTDQGSLYASEITDKDLQTDRYGYIRESAISETALSAFSKQIAPSIFSDDDLFFYIYGVLHVPSYREKYAANLSKELPRIPLPKNSEQFWALAEAGRKLGDLHVDYEDAKEYPIDFERGGWEPNDEVNSEEWFRVVKMKHPGTGRNKDRTQIIYNDYITIQNIPEEAYDYVVNGKSAIAWVMERQGVKTDKDSQIVNDANRFAIETMKDPAYPLRLLAKVITVSLETITIVDGLREIDFSD